MLTIDQVTRLGERGETILDDVSLRIESGETVGLTGRSGSGKSSLLRCIAWLDRIESGDLRLDGVSVRQMRVPQYRRQVVYLPQRPSLVAGTVLDNLSLSFRLDAATRTFDPKIAGRWLDMFDAAAPDPEQPSEQLSGGQQQCVALVRALLLEPRILLLDEPTTALDETSRDQFESVLRFWKTEKPTRSWIWSSHDPKQINRMTSRSLRMDAGQLHEVADA